MSPSIISLKEYRNMLIEPELGFLVDKDIIQTIESRDSLGDFVSAVYPIIELPDVGFENLSEVTVIDIICTNAGAKKYIVGNKNLIENLDLNNIKTRLYRDGKLISSGTSSEVMQGQKSALLWLINDLISKNYEIKSGYILLTGSIGEAYKASQGQYMADFGKLGKIYFEIR
ncbi:MAG: hypothetical protein GTN99_03065 [Candidatus Dadabacteria bacterium]|nr:hypothetical protein [Candidatus Dadabacteria bacterium]